MSLVVGGAAKALEVHLPEGVFEVAARKARYGHKDWIVWRGRDGREQAALCTADAIKSALMAVGTQGRFVRLAASTATGTSTCWRLGLIMLRNCRRGHDGPAVRH